MNRAEFNFLSWTYRLLFRILFGLHMFPEAFATIACGAELYDKHYDECHPEEEYEDGPVAI